MWLRSVQKGGGGPLLHGQVPLHRPGQQGYALGDVAVLHLHSPALEQPGLTAIANGRQLVGRPQEDAGRKTVSVATALPAATSSPKKKRPGSSRADSAPSLWN